MAANWDEPELRGQLERWKGVASNLTERLQEAEAVLDTQWEHRCSDGVGGCTAVSASALETYERKYLHLTARR